MSDTLATILDAFPQKPPKMSKTFREITITLERFDVDVVETKRGRFKAFRGFSDVVLAEHLSLRELEIFMKGVIAGGFSK